MRWAAVGHRRRARFALRRWRIPSRWGHGPRSPLPTLLHSGEVDVGGRSGLRSCRAAALRPWKTSSAACGPLHPAARGPTARPAPSTRVRGRGAQARPRAARASGVSPAELGIRVAGGLLPRRLCPEARRLRGGDSAGTKTVTLKTDIKAERCDAARGPANEIRPMNKRRKDSQARAHGPGRSGR